MRALRAFGRSLQVIPASAVPGPPRGLVLDAEVPASPPHPRCPGRPQASPICPRQIGAPSNSPTSASWPAPLRGVHVRGHRPRTVGAQVLEHLCLRSTVATVSTVSPLPFGPPLFRRIAHSGQASRVRSARFSPGPCASLRAAASEPALAPCPPIALHASRRLQRAEINETKDEGKP